MGAGAVVVFNDGDLVKSAVGSLASFLIGSEADDDSEVSSLDDEDTCCGVPCSTSISSPWIFFAGLVFFRGEIISCFVSSCFSGRVSSVSLFKDAARRFVDLPMVEV